MWYYCLHRVIQPVLKIQEQNLNKVAPKKEWVVLTHPLNFNIFNKLWNAYPYHLGYHKKVSKFLKCHAFMSVVKLIAMISIICSPSKIEFCGSFQLYSSTDKTVQSLQ